MTPETNERTGTKSPSRYGILDQITKLTDGSEENKVSRKKLNRQLIIAEATAQNDSKLLKSRINVLVAEDSKMLRKIEETRRLADKMKKARQQNEEKLE